MDKITDWKDVPLVFGIEQAVILLGFSCKTIQKMARNGQIPSKKINRTWRFNKQEIMDWLEGIGQDERV